MHQPFYFQDWSHIFLLFRAENFKLEKKYAI